MPNRCHDDIMPWGKGKGLNNKHKYGKKYTIIIIPY